MNGEAARTETTDGLGLESSAMSCCASTLNHHYHLQSRVLTLGTMSNHRLDARQ